MLIVRDESPDHLATQLDARLCAFNESHVGPRRNEKLALAIRDGEQLLAGLFAEIFWNALHIDLLWVAAEHRRRGLVARSYTGRRSLGASVDVTWRTSVRSTFRRRRSTLRWGTA